MSIPREQWIAAREDYVRGRGSLATIATRHNLKRGSVEKRARNENWTQLRDEFEAVQLAKLIPPPPARLPDALVAPHGAVSEGWLRARQEIHYQRNAMLLDKIRFLLGAKLEASEKPSTDELGKLTSALSNLVSAEIALLGLNRNRRQEKKSRRITPFYIPEPEPEPEPIEQEKVGEHAQA